MKFVQFADTRGKLRALIQELPDISDNAVCFLDNDDRAAAYLISPHGLAKILTDATCPEPDEETIKFFRQKDDEFRRLMESERNPIDDEIDKLLEDPDIRRLLDSEEWKQAVDSFLKNSKAEGKAEA